MANLQSGSTGSKGILQSGVSGFENTIVVSRPQDFKNIDSTKNYMIDGAIDMGTTSIEIPETGISLSGINGGRDTSILYSTEDNYAMFTSPSGGYSGNVVLESCTLDVTGSSSQIFDLDNDGNNSALDIVGVNFGRSPVNRMTSMGELTDYRQLLMNNVGFIFMDDGLTFNGAWTGAAITTSIAVGFAAATLFKEGTNLSFSGSVRSDINFLSADSASVLFDFNPSDVTSDGGFSLSNVRTSATDAVPNFPASSVKARFRNCEGIRNTYVGGEWTISAETETTISTANTPVKLAGTTTYEDLNWFSNTTDNSFLYDSSQEIEVEIKGSITVSGSNNKVGTLIVRQWDDSASSYIDLRGGMKFTLTGGGGGNRAENIAILAFGVMEQNDRIELWIENNTDATNMTGILGGVFAVNERSS